MKPEALLTGIAVLLMSLFVLTRNAYFMGATVFVATPLVLVSIAFYIRRVFKDLKDNELM